MTWEHDSTINKGPCHITVAPSSGRRWRFFSMDFGSHSEASHEECLKTWPREAIARARAELDKFENLLERDYETAMERRQADG